MDEVIPGREPSFGEPGFGAPLQGLGVEESLALSGPPDAHHRALLEDLREPSTRDRLNDGELTEVVGEWARQAAAAHAGMLREIAQLLDRPGMAAGSPHLRAAQLAAAELETMLGISRARADAYVHQAHLLTGDLWPVLVSLDDGQIDAGKAALFVEILTDQPLEACIAVMDSVLPAAPELNHSALRRRLRRALIAADPNGCAARARQAFLRRRVNAPRPRSDGMASFSALLAAPAAAAMDQVCEAAGRAAHATGDQRTLDQLRADVLATLAETALLTGEVGAEGVSNEVFRFDPKRARLVLTANDAVLAGTPTGGAADTILSELRSLTHADGASDFAGRPDVAAGNGTRTGAGKAAGDGGAEYASDGGAERESVTVPPFMRVASDQARALPAPVAAASRAAGDADAAATVDNPATRDGSATPDNPATPGNPATRGTGVGTGVDETASLGYLSEADVPELAGYGPIAPALVPDLAAMSWIRVSEPSRVGEQPAPTPRYRPSAALDRYVRTRDRTCQAPGCGISAWRCDLDHIIEFPAGPTAAGNLRALCRHHHRLKTFGGHRYRLDRRGTLTWSTPAGQRVSVRDDGSTAREAWLARARIACSPELEPPWVSEDAADLAVAAIW